MLTPRVLHVPWATISPPRQLENVKYVPLLLTVFHAAQLPHHNASYAKTVTSLRQQEHALNAALVALAAPAPNTVPVLVMVTT